MGWYERLQKKSSAYLGALDDWATSTHLAQAYLLLANFFLALKASTNILAFLSNSSSLILDYNGLVLFSSLFAYCFVSMNLLVFLSSLLCLLALMLTLKNNSLRLLLINCYTFSQIFLITVTMILMARLWLVPIKPDLSKELPNWQEEMKNYDYSLSKSLVRLLPKESFADEKFVDQFDRSETISGEINANILNTRPVSTKSRTNRVAVASVENDLLQTATLNKKSTSHQSAIEIYSYSKQLDRLQQTLGCCGIQGPSDWVTYNTEWGLLAPSCCQHPIAFKTRRRRSNATTITANEETMKRSYRKEVAAHSRGASMVSISGNTMAPSNSQREDWNSFGGKDSDETKPLATDGDNDDEEIIYYCPMNDLEVRNVRGETLRTSNDETSGLKQFHLRPNELLEIQLAIEWTGSRAGRFQLNQQQQQLQLSIVYGCQRTIDERDSRCLFGLRFSLLILVSLLFLNVIARSAAFETARRKRRDQFNQSARSARIVSGSNATSRPRPRMTTSTGVNIWWPPSHMSRQGLGRLVVVESATS